MADSLPSGVLADISLPATLNYNGAVTYTCDTGYYATDQSTQDVKTCNQHGISTAPTIPCSGKLKYQMML